jgi:type II secretory pathway pseudopilin PulG
MIEILVVMSITAILSMIIFLLSSSMTDKAKCAVCMGQMRQIGSAMLARGMENQDVLFTRTEVGNSNYREWRDPLSLCQLLQNYLAGDQVWMSPGAHKRARPFKNSYAWTRALNLSNPDPENRPRMSLIEKPHNTLLLWNAFNYTLPSIYNVPEGGSNGGPRAASSQYHHRPWQRKKAVNWLYLDLHVATK